MGHEVASNSSTVSSMTMRVTEFEGDDVVVARPAEDGRELAPEDAVPAPTAR
jgi:hypothetical protein